VGQPYIGEIRMFGGNFAPAGWMFCQGQTIPISENDALFTLIGTTYGGDGQETFQLPDLQGRLPLHAGQGPGISQNYQLGEKGGVESVTISTQTMPIHNHAAIASNDAGTSPNPSNNLLAVNNVVQFFSGDVGNNPMAGSSILPVGGSQPHENLQPYLCVSFIISLFGVFPTQT
jgi:microcystin-dependent protein